jgi:A/G-specific adenine glycosylase
MDLGATVCMPRNPLCTQCPLQANCLAYQNNVIGLLPVRSKKTVVKKRYFHYLLLNWQNSIWIQKRTRKDIWENLHEPYLLESLEPMDMSLLILNEHFKKEQFNFTDIRLEDINKQRLTHQIIESRFFSVVLTERPEITSSEGKWIGRKELRKIAFPKTVLSFLENNLYF